MWNREYLLVFFLIVCLIVMAGSGTALMKKIDCFLEKNNDMGLKKRKLQEPFLRIALDNPVWIGSLEPVLEQYAYKRKDVSLYFYSADAAQIRKALKDGNLDLGVISVSEGKTGNVDAADDSCRGLPVPGCQSCMRDEKTGVVIEPMEIDALKESICVTVLWNDRTLSAAGDEFLQMLHFQIENPSGKCYNC
ncbi:MAG: hypothetical protein Q4F21_11730 [Lachnospiraceae bacterium]|nr:hypothetical protein [Lachnospiraceae bacterium]